MQAISTLRFSSPTLQRGLRAQTAAATFACGDDDDHQHDEYSPKAGKPGEHVHGSGCGHHHHAPLFPTPKGQPAKDSGKSLPVVSDPASTSTPTAAPKPASKVIAEPQLLLTRGQKFWVYAVEPLRWGQELLLNSRKAIAGSEPIEKYDYFRPAHAHWVAHHKA